MEKFIPDPARLQAVEENWKRVLDRVQEGAVKSGRDPREVRLMAVTKTVEPVYINRALDLGADLIGEIGCRNTWASGMRCTWMGWKST